MVDSVLVSYFEYLPEDVIYGKLEDKMGEVYTKVQDAVNQYNCTYREGAKYCCYEKNRKSLYC